MNFKNTTVSSKAMHKFVNLIIKTIEQPLVGFLAYKGTKSISAMIRVKNEEEFLRDAVLSILDIVDEVVIIDNGSTDETPLVITRLSEQFPEKIRSFTYPYKVARYGEENRILASTRAGRRSPSLLMNFYNWSISKCRYQFILKWDGDTIATTAFAEVLTAFKTSPKQALWLTGANLHPNLNHLIKGRPYETLEPRVFYRRLAHYDNSLGYCETLRSPYVGRFIEYSEFYKKPAYLHMKFCKRDPYMSMSKDLQREIDLADTAGDPVDEFIKHELMVLHLASKEKFVADNSALSSEDILSSN